MAGKAQPEIIHEQLSSAFYDRVDPAVFPQHILRYRNQLAAESLGLGHLDDQAFISHFGQFKPFEGSFDTPLALRYHGHQFGHYNPDLGDGRGFLFAQFRQKDTGQLLDLGTKGSGQTPYSRSADGRLTLKGAVREILATEMLSALNVRTSQSFSVIETGEALLRGDEPSPTRAAVLVRLLHSHIRIGSFQRLAYLGEQENIETLLRHVIRYYYPQLDADGEIIDLIPSFLQDFSEQVAEMIAGWMVAGFVHGVLNTDNFNITGQSFDYGPWRFLPVMNTGFTAAYFDDQGRYAYGRQPEAGLWALCRLADCFADYIPPEQLGAALQGFYLALERAIARNACWRLGVAPEDDLQAEAICQQLFTAAGKSGMGWDLLFKEAYAGQFERNELSSLWQSDDEMGRLADMLKTLRPRQTDAKAIEYIRSSPLVTLELSVMESLWSPIALADDWSKLNQHIEDIRAHGRALQAD